MSNLAKLSVDVFLDLMLDTPDIEAEQEIVARKDYISLQCSMLQKELSGMRKGSDQAAEIGRDLFILCADNSRMTARLKELRIRRERLSWSNAVRAVFGEEGWARCREWMVMNEVNHS